MTARERAELKRRISEIRRERVRELDRGVNCLYCGEPLPEDASPMKLYCGKKCSSKASIRRERLEAAIQKRKRQTCPKGHLVAGDNAYLQTKNNAVCAICRREAKRLHARKVRQAQKNGPAPSGSSSPSSLPGGSSLAADRRGRTSTKEKT